MDDLLAEFLAETNESLEGLDTSLVRLEKNPDDKELLSEIFRIAHTIKGTCGFLNLPRLGAVAHKAEDLLGLFREGALPVSAQSVTLILESLDRIKSILADLERTGAEPEGDDAALLQKLAAACDGSPDLETPPEHDVSGVQNISAAEPVTGVQSLRVGVDVLENLMTLVSELVLTRNQILQVARTQKDNGMTGSLQRLNHIVSDLQDGVMKTRMQPIGMAWGKLPRIVRDIAQDLGKKIDLDMTGQETELDRQVLDIIRDPLTHMVRNSADHGIEMPDVRARAGKAETGKIRLDAYHEGGYIIIEIADDGKGLALDKIKEKILEKNILPESELAALSVQQIQQYIFHAGFSTAQSVTSISGRGVGMDVVRTNIEKIGGSIEMESAEGKGTTFIIKIPLTLAIIPSLIVGVSAERFAIPQVEVAELVMIAGGGRSRIETINNTPVFRLRERILPLISLHDLLSLPPCDEEGLRYIVVINVGAYSFGMIVDRVFDTEEIVVKPVGSLMSKQAVFSGNTILGDGQVIMILDSAGILRTCGIMDSTAAERDRQADKRSEDKSARDETHLLLFSAGSDQLKAVPLHHVARLEEVDLANVEMAGGKRVVQYGDTLMPIHLYDPQMSVPATGKRPVIVFKTRDGQAGLLVDRILDITTHTGEYQMKSDGALEGSAIIRGQVADIININYVPPARPQMPERAL